MRLAQCIQANVETILTEWEAFASTLYSPSTKMTPRLLRDHAQQILAAVIADLATLQTDEQQSEKAMGRAPLIWNAPETAAQTHAVLRAQSGIDINQLAAEYRALRASVLRLWEEKCEGSPEGVQDMIRFNEAIDQALAESISYFTAQIERARNLSIGTLVHDMRNPLNAIVMTAQNMAHMDQGREVSDSADCLIRSGASITALLNDLVDFSRMNLGVGIDIEVREADLSALFEDELQQVRAAHPGRTVEATMNGNLKGRWDGKRLQRVLRNLVSNALTYGTQGEPVRVFAHGGEKGVVIEVKNRGPAIDPSTAERLFDPLKRGVPESSRAHQEGLGLGLYIVREIARAHGGDVEMRSDADETVFSVRLPPGSGHAGFKDTSTFR